MSEVLKLKTLLENEQKRLKQECSLWEDEERSNNSIPDNVSEEIRCAIGKAYLLINGKLKQFSGLIATSEEGTEGNKIQVADLLGFWDLICIEISDLDNSFRLLNQLKKNQWIEIEECSRISKRSPGNRQLVKAAVSKTYSHHNAAARKRLAEVKSEMKASKSKKLDAKEDVVFEVPAFFSVRSPVKGRKESSALKNAAKQEGNMVKDNTKTPIKDYSPLLQVTREIKKIIHNDK